MENVTRPEARGNWVLIGSQSTLEYYSVMALYAITLVGLYMLIVS